MNRLISVFSPTLFLVTAAMLPAQTINVDKNPLSLTALAGSTTPATTTVNVTTSSSALQSWVAFNNTGNNAAPWLKVNGGAGASGSFPGSFNVSADPTGLPVGTYNGVVRVASGTVFTDIQVTFSVSPIGVNVQALSFGPLQLGSALPNPQTINFTGNTNVAYTASATTSSGGAWLQVSPASGIAPQQPITVSVTSVAQGLAAGTYAGTVNITPSGVSGAAPIAIPVSLVVSALPAITVSPNPVNLNFQIGGTNNNTSQTLSLNSNGSQPVSFFLNLAADPNPAGRIWFTVNPSQGTVQSGTASQVTVAYDTTANLPAGTYNGKITVFTPSGSPTQQDIPVKLLVSTAPLLNLTPGSLNFTAQLNAGSPAAQPVTATSTSGQMTLSITTGTANGGNWLSAPTTGVTGTPFNVTVSPAGLGVGTYNGTVTVNGAGAGNNPQTVSVTLTITNNPVIGTSINFGMSFAYQVGQSAPAVQPVQLYSSTGVPLNYTATASSSTCGNNWLALGGATTGTTPNTINVSINTAGLTASATPCSGTITINATNSVTGAAIPQATIPVTLVVSNNALLVVTPPAAPIFTAQSGSSSGQSQNCPGSPANTCVLTISSTSPTDQIPYNVTFSTQQGGSWLFAAPLSGVTGTGNNTVLLQVNPSLLSPGTYNGSVVITAPTSQGGAAVTNSPVTVPVILVVSAGALAASPATLSFTQTASGTAPAAQTIQVTSNGQPLQFTATATNAGTVQWLSVNPSSGTTPGSISVSVDGSKLAPSTTPYTGTITISAAGASNSPITVPVSLTINPGALTVSPASLTFTQVQGAAAPAGQSINVTGAPGAINFTATPNTTTGGQWLVVNPASGTTPGAVQVTINSGATNLAIGQYTGQVTITPQGATSGGQTVNVTLNVVAPQTLTVSPGTVSFSAVTGTGAPAPQQVQLSSSGGVAQFSLTATTQSGGNWLKVSPTSGSTPAALTITADPTGLAVGNYTGTITVNSPNSAQAATITVNLNVSAIPQPVISQVKNAASYQTGSVSPGENIAIFGTGLGPATLLSAQYPQYPTILSDTQVFFDNIAAPIIYVSATQTSVMVPYEIFGRASTNIRVVYKGVQSDPLNYQVSSAVPGIYTQNASGTGPGSILNQDYSVNGPGNGESAGRVVAVYMTGEGVTNPPSTTGAVAPGNGTGLNKPVLQVTASIAGIPVIPEYAGSVPTLIYGVMQVNLRVPAGLAPGQYPVVVNVGNASTQQGVTVTIK